MNIYFTDQFINSIENDWYSIELKKYKLGRLKDRKDGKVITHPSEIDYEYMIKHDVTSPTNDYYMFDSSYSREDETLRINLKVPSYDEGMLESDDSESIYKVIYVMYRDVLTNSEDIAFIIYDRIKDTSKLRANGLYLSKLNNIININILAKCEIITKIEGDISHLEGPGVNYLNFYSIDSDDNFNYIEKRSYDRYYHNSICSNNPYHGKVTINKFGLKTY